MRIKIKKHLDKIGLAVLAMSMPMTAFAQQSSSCLETHFSGSGKTIAGLIDYITCLARDTIVPFLFLIAMVVFLWGVIQFIKDGENEESREKGKQFMLWGIVGLAVMVSVWGLVAVFTRSFGITGNETVPVPKLPK